MAVNLTKGQKVDLTKGTKITKLMVGLGWDSARVSSKNQNQGGFLNSLKAVFKPVVEIDCDASVLMLDKKDKLRRQVQDLIYFGNLKSDCGGVIHAGDNLTGDGDGVDDDEKIMIDLSKIPANVEKLLFVVNIYDCIKRQQDFGMVQNAYIRVVDTENKKELIRYNLTDDYAKKTAVLVGEIYRQDSEWKFGAIGEGKTVASLRQIIEKYS